MVEVVVDHCFEAEEQGMSDLDRQQSQIYVCSKGNRSLRTWLSSTYTVNIPGSDQIGDCKRITPLS